MAAAALALSSGITLEDKNFKENTMLPGGKVIWVALIILGVVGIGTAAVGFVGYGAQQGWWSILSQLGHTNSIVMMGCGVAGGVILIAIGIVGQVKQTRLTGLALVYSAERLRAGLVREYDHTYVLQRNGKYTLIAHRKPEEGGAPRPAVIAQDIDPQIFVLTEADVNDIERYRDDPPQALEAFSREHHVGRFPVKTSLLPAEVAELRERLLANVEHNQPVREKMIEILDSIAFQADPVTYVQENCPNLPSGMPADPTLRAWRYIMEDLFIKRIVLDQIRN